MHKSADRREYAGAPGGASARPGLRGPRRCRCGGPAAGGLAGARTEMHDHLAVVYCSWGARFSPAVLQPLLPRRRTVWVLLTSASAASPPTCSCCRPARQVRLCRKARLTAPSVQPERAGSVRPPAQRLRTAAVALPEMHRARPQSDSAHTYPAGRAAADQAPQSRTGLCACPGNTSSSGAADSPPPLAGCRSEAGRDLPPAGRALQIGRGGEEKRHAWSW